MTNNYRTREAALDRIRHINHLSSSILVRAFRHRLHFFQFRFLETKVLRHLDYLTGINEILWIGTELPHAWSKLATTHGLRFVETEITLAVVSVVQTEVADCHTLNPLLRALT